MIPNTHIQERKEGDELMSPPSRTSSETPEQKDFLWRMYCETRNDLRNLRAERSTASNMILVTSIGVIGFVARHKIVYDDWPLTLGLICIGVFGFMFVANHFHCIDSSKKKADYYFCHLNKLLGLKLPSEIEEVTTTNKRTAVSPADWNDEGFPDLRRLSFVGKFRVLWPLIIAVIGIIATAYLFIVKPTN